MITNIKKTAPDTLEAVFMSFRTFLPERSNTNVTILDAWIKTFDAQTISQSALYTRIGQISDLLEEINIQIESMSNLSDPRKARARSVISNFLPTVTLRTLFHDGWNIRENCSVENCGSLGLLGDALRPKFSENVLSSEDIEDILSVLSEVRTSLDDDRLPLRLRISLQRQIDILIWRLKHPDFETLQQASDALGRVTLSANQLERLCPDDDSREHASEVRGKLLGCFQKTVDVMERGAKGVVAVKIAHDALAPLLGT